jgi:hypothetical protein
MPLPTNVITNNLTFTLSAAAGATPVDYSCEITNLIETITTTGGETVTTACGSIRNPLVSTITGIDVTFVQSKETAGLFRRLRETPSVKTEVATWSGNATITEGATAPEWSATVSGWSLPTLTASASGAPPTVTVSFTFSTVPVVDVTTGP